MSVARVEHQWNKTGWKTDEPEDDRDKRKYQLIAVIVHLVLLLVLALPWISYHVPASGLQGIVVNFGEPDQGGQAVDGAISSSSEQEVSVPEEANFQDQLSPNSEMQPDEPSPSSQQPLIVDRDEPEVFDEPSDSAEKARKAERERQQQEAELARVRERAEREAAERAAAEEQQRKEQEYQKAKQQYTDLFKGSGKENSKPGTTGERNGKEGEEVLAGLTTGAGRVGDGLGDRGVVYYPRIEDRSQQTGTVVIYICVDEQGKVEVARFTQKGSTTTDQHLVQLALETARKYRFTTSSIASQCGTITFDFKVK